MTPGGPKEAPHVGGHFPGMSLFIDPGLYKQSVHADVSCTDCHADVKDVPHTARLKPADCSGCHSEVAATYAKSRHVLTFGKSPIGNAPACVDCHGAHAVPKSSVSTSPVYFRNIAATCTRCHGDQTITDGRNIAIPGAAKQYQQSIHNRAIVDMGLNKSASCIDCHGAHDMKDRRRRPSSSINQTNLPATCGKCHFGVYALYKDSVHGDGPGARCPRRPQLRGLPRRARHPRRHRPELPRLVRRRFPDDVRLLPRRRETGRPVRGAGRQGARVPGELPRPLRAPGGQDRGELRVLSRRRRDPPFVRIRRSIFHRRGFAPPAANTTSAHGELRQREHPGGPGGIGERIKYLVEQFYIWMIVVVIGGMVVHNGFDYFRKMQTLYRKGKQ